MKIGVANLVINAADQILCLKCAKGRGFILPGGKVEEGELFSEAAARELMEETGNVAGRRSLIFHAPDVSGFYCYCYLTEVQDWKLGFNSDEGRAVLGTWGKLMRSSFAQYYECLREIYETKYRPYIW